MNNLQTVNNSLTITSDLMANWIDYIDVSSTSLQGYNRAIRQFFNYLKANSITQPTRQDILNYKSHLLETKKSTTVQLYLTAVKQFFKWTAQEEIYSNIADNIKGVKLDKGFKKDYLTSNQVKTVLSTIDTSSNKGLRDHAIISLMVTTGLRTIEIARANKEDLRTVGDSTVLFIQGKGRTEKNEYVKLSSQVEQIINKYLASRVDVGTALFNSVSNKNQSDRMTTRSISRIVKGRFIQANLNSTRLTAHSLRHTTATLNLMNGGTAEETQQLLRHSNINTTMIYSHALERSKNDSEQRVSDSIF